MSSSGPASAANTASGQSGSGTPSPEAGSPGFLSAVSPGGDGGYSSSRTATPSSKRSPSPNKIHTLPTASGLAVKAERPKIGLPPGVAAAAPVGVGDGTGSAAPASAAAAGVDPYWRDYQPPSSRRPAAEARASSRRMEARVVAGKKLAKAAKGRPGRKPKTGSAPINFGPMEPRWGREEECPFWFPPCDPRGGMNPWNFATVSITPLITPNTSGILPDWEKGFVAKWEKERWSRKHPMNLVWEGPPAPSDTRNRVRIWIHPECVGSGVAPESRHRGRPDVHGLCPGQ